MIALYVFDSKNKGINLFGSDSLIFNTMPSCFGLRINNILMLNISTDFFCSKGCGLPSPRSIKLLMSNNEGKIKYEGVEYAQEISNPITDLKIFKPVVWLYQPIKQPTDDPIFHGGYYGHLNLSDSRIMSRTLDNNDRLGALFRQYNDRIEILKDPNVVVNFDSVTGDECAAQKDIAASVYKLQASLWSAIEYETIESDKMVSTIKLDHDAKLRDAEMRAKMYLELGTQNH